MKIPRLAALLAATALVLAGCAGKSAVDQGTGSFRFVSGTSNGTLIPADHRKKAGSFSGSLLNGGTFHSSADAGLVTVVNFWATWCGPCTTETPQFDSIYRADKSEGVTFVGIDTKESGRSDPRSFVKDNDISYPIVYDEEGETAVALGRIPALGLPFTVLIDKQGRVAAVYLGALTDKDLQPVLTKLVAES